MIFNPLFLSESSGGQMLVPKSNKLSNNKYLFSDIVKVVMNPLEEQEKILGEIDNVIGNNSDLTLDKNESPVKLKLKFLSDSDNEQAKLGLAEILPDEIAQLLINDKANLSDEKAVSYISKELLKGELQSFVNDLVGNELIEKNISNESGLLLSLEDKKSAVNIELAKDSSSKSKGDKIVVQTLVVPEKAKLLSLVKGSKNNPLFNFNNSSVSESGSISKTGLANNSNTEIIKPTLSVYSFNYGKNNFESLTKNIKSNSGHKHNLSLISNNSIGELNQETKKIPLEKISFVPSELKKQLLDGKQTTIGKNLELTSKGNELKLIDKNLPKADKNYSVNKITIVKKNVDTLITEKLNNKSKVSAKEIEPSLKRIDFSKGDGSSNKLLNQLGKNKDISNVKYIKTNSKVPKTTGVKQSPDLKVLNSEKPTNVAHLKALSKVVELNKTQGSVKNNTQDLSTPNTGQKEGATIKLRSEQNSIKSSQSDNSIISKNLTEAKSKVEILKNMNTTIENKESSQTKEVMPEKGTINKITNVNVESNKSIASSKVKVNSEINTTKVENLEKPAAKFIDQNGKEILNVKNKLNNNTDAKVESNKSITSNTAKLNSEINTTKIENLEKPAVKLNNQNSNEILNAKNTLNNNTDVKVESNKSITSNTVKLNHEINTDKIQNSEKTVSTPDAQNVKNHTKTATVLSNKKSDEIITNNSKDIKEANINSRSVEKSGSELKNGEEIKYSESKNERVEIKKTVETSKQDSIKSNVVNPTNSNDTAESKGINQTIVNPNVTDIRSTNENKKVSVKVKGGIKSISDKSETNKAVVSDNSVKDNSSNNSSENSDNNNSSSFKGASFPSNDFNLKPNPESEFNQLLAKEEISKLSASADKAIEVEAQSNHKMVKSAEVIKEISRFISKQEKGSLSFDIKPEQLGKMKITLDTTEHVIKARIEVENEQAKQLIERNINKLHEELSENGIQLNSLNISLGYSKQQKEEKEVDNNNQKHAENLGQMGEAEEETQKKTLGYNTYEYIA
jgi:flagellar hook-length control protein FliK